MTGWDGVAAIALALVRYAAADVDHVVTMTERAWNRAAARPRAGPRRA